MSAIKLAVNNIRGRIERSDWSSKTNHPPTPTVCIKGHCSVTPLPGWIYTDLHPQGMSKSYFVRSFSAESPSSSFSDSRVNGAELKEGAAQFPPRRSPPEPPDPEPTNGQENDETDRKRLQQDQLMGHTTPYSVTPTTRPPLRSLSLNSQRESIHRSPTQFLAEFPPFQVATQINHKQSPLRLDPRLQCISQGSRLPSTPPMPVPALPLSVSEVTTMHTNSEMVLHNSHATITPFCVMPDSNTCKSLDALPIRLSTPVSEVHVSGHCKDELICKGRSQAQCEYQQPTAIQRPIVDNDLYIQQGMIRNRAWMISDKVKAAISIEGEGDTLIDGHPIAKCILKKFRRNFESYRGDIASCCKDPRKIFTAKLCTTRKKVLLPYWMDSSIEELESEFSKQFQQTSNSITWPRESQRDITIPILVAIMYCSAYGVSISFEHFVNSGCSHCAPYSRRVQWTVIKLKDAHDTTCRKLKSCNGEKPWEEIVAACKVPNIIYGVYKSEKSQSWLIEYPHFVEIHLQPTDRLGRVHTLPCLYMQIPPFCFAVPLFESDGSRDESLHHLLKSRFAQVVREINKQLLTEQERFFEREPELQKNKQNLGLIYPYCFDSKAECRYLRITI